MSVLKWYNEKKVELENELRRLEGLGNGDANVMDERDEVALRLRYLKYELFERFQVGDKLLVVDEDAINGEKYWYNGEIVEIRAVDNDYDGSRIEVWDVDKTSSEYVFFDELGAFDLVGGVLYRCE